MHDLFTARPVTAGAARSHTSRASLAVLLMAMLFVTIGVVVSAPASAAPNPETCEGYPEPRVYLESHAWWNTILSGTEDFGHLHTEACFPRTHDPDGSINAISGTLHLDVKVVMHHNPGVLDWVRVQVSGDGFNNVGAMTKLHETCDGQNDPDWDAAMGACTWWVPMDVDTTVAGADGFNEFRVSAKVTEPTGDEMRNSTGWQAYLANGRSVNHYRSDIGAFTEARGWYEGSGYAVGRLASPLPYEVSGTWSPDVVMDKGAGGKDVGWSFASVDPHFHFDDEGMKLVDQAGPFRGRISIDTTKLTDGEHRLYLQARSPCDGTSGNDCGTKANGADNNVATVSGGQVVHFVVNNGGTAPAPDPTQDPTTEPATDPTTEPTTEPTTDPAPDPSPSTTQDPVSTVHVGDMDATSRRVRSRWSGTVVTQLHDGNEQAVPGAVVHVRVTVDGRDDELTCRTDGAGECTVVSTMHSRVGSFTAEVVGIDADAAYVADADHDPDVGTPGTLTITRP